jgi:hypothetical protein
MVTNRDHKVLLVVLERGSVWPDCVEECRLRGAYPVVMVQSEIESPSELAERACARLKRLAASGTRLYGGAIATGDAAEDDFAVSRCTMAQTIAVSMHQAAESGKRLWLVAPEHACPRIRDQLLALAGDLTSQVTDSELTVSVQFRATTPPARRAEGWNLVPFGRGRTA